MCQLDKTGLSERRQLNLKITSIAGGARAGTGICQVDETGIRELKMLSSQGDPELLLFFLACVLSGNNRSIEVHKRSNWLCSIKHRTRLEL